MSEQQVNKILLSKRYFYCFSYLCKNIIENDGIFCNHHNRFNVSKLKEKPEEISREEVRKMIKKYIEENWELLNIDLQILNQVE